MKLFEPGEGTAHYLFEIPSPDRYDFLFRLALQAGLAWPWGGRPPSVEGFVDTLWSNTSANAVVIARSDGLPVGYISLEKTSLYHGTAFISVYIERSQQRSAAMEAVLFLVDRIFNTTPIRKLYFESIGETAELYNSTPYLLQEARYADHLRLSSDTYGDLVVNSLRRETWLDIRASALPFIEGKRS